MESTSTNTFKEILDVGLLSKRRAQVYEQLIKYGPCTASELRSALSEDQISWAEHAHKRLLELEQQGVAKRSQIRKCKISGFRAWEWEAVTGTPRKLPAGKKSCDKFQKVIVASCSKCPLAFFSDGQVKCSLLKGRAIRGIKIPSQCLLRQSPILLSVEA